MNQKELSAALGISKQQVSNILHKDRKEKWQYKLCVFALSFTEWEFKKRLDEFQAYIESSNLISHSGQSETRGETLTMKEIIDHVEQHGSSATKGALKKYEDSVSLSTRVKFEWEKDLDARSKASVMRGAVKKISTGIKAERCSNNYPSKFCIVGV
jgi:transcriptional regulator with XRE-family HTH domain